MLRALTWVAQTSHGQRSRNQASNRTRGADPCPPTRATPRNSVVRGLRAATTDCKYGCTVHKGGYKGVVWSGEDAEEGLRADYRLYVWVYSTQRGV
eukprot:1181607-Prorocentrum_minimum.AAC.1